MKILTAIESSKRAEEMAHTTFRWAARAGFDIRIFIPDRRQLKKYQAAVDDANYHYYLVGRDETKIITPKQKPLDYAREHGYDLVILLPDTLLDYSTVENDDKSMVEFAEDAGAARKQFGLNPNLIRLALARNDRCLMVRV